MIGHLEDLVQARGTRPIIRWAGSKRQHLEKLRAFWSPDFERYVEPFAGSCAFFFDLMPEKALLADKNAELIDAYRAICEWPEKIFDVLIEIPRTRERYYTERGRQGERLTRIERAIRFLYLNRNCFNGIYRTNLKGEFNVPFGADKAGTYLPRPDFLIAARLLQKATLRCWDFGTTLRHCSANDFVYLDPPYAVKSCRVFKEYGPQPFSRDDLARLEGHLKALDSKGAAFVMSYQKCEEATKLGQRWTTRNLRVHRNIAGFAHHRRMATELLITNIGDNEVARA